jgi:hypothetical protein
LLGPAVEFGVPELDVGLRGGEAHGVAAWGTGCVGPEGGVGEAFVEAGVAEYAEGEGGEDSGFLFLVESVG